MQLWEIYLEHVLGEVVRRWSQGQWGVEIPSTAVGQSGGPADKTPPWRKAECDPCLNHMAWADHIVLAPNSLECSRPPPPSLMSNGRRPNFDA